MKKVFSSIVATLAVLSYAAVAGAIPATTNPDQAISVMENENQGKTVPPEQQGQPAKKQKKVRKQHKPRHKKTAPAASAAPAAGTAPQQGGSPAAR